MELDSGDEKWVIKDGIRVLSGEIKEIKKKIKEKGMSKALKDDLKELQDLLDGEFSVKKETGKA